MKDQNHVRVPKVGEIKRFGCGTFFGVSMLILLLIFPTLGISDLGWTLVAPYILGKTCELPHTMSKRFLKHLVRRMKTNILSTNRGTERWGAHSLYYLSKLTTRDQLYVIHNAIIDANGLFQNQNSRIYEYKISPIYLNGIRVWNDPTYYIHPWVSIRIRIWDEKNTVLTAKKATPPSPSMSTRLPGFDIVSLKFSRALSFRFSSNICPELEPPHP